MDKYIIDRVLEEANYMLLNKSTVRDIAYIYNVSKSTVHKDLQERLRDINGELHTEIDKIFKIIRGKYERYWNRFRNSKCINLC